MCHDMIMAHPSLFNKPDRGLGIIQKTQGTEIPYLRSFCPLCLLSAIIFWTRGECCGLLLVYFVVSWIVVEFFGLLVQKLRGHLIVVSSVDVYAW